MVLLGQLHPKGHLMGQLDTFISSGDTPMARLKPVLSKGYSLIPVAIKNHNPLFDDLAGLTATHKLNILSARFNTRKVRKIN
jgi:hypothetical protein